MSDASIFDQQMLHDAFAEVDSFSRKIPKPVLAELANEVVRRVSRNLAVPVRPEPLISAEVDALCDALLSKDPSAAASYIATAQRQGISYQAICETYLGAAAVRLGDWWDKDKVSFFEVTIGAGRIYAILRILRLNQVRSQPDMRRSAIFAAVPGENHTLGITIAADLARDRGWDVELFVGLGHEELVTTLDQRRPSVVGLSGSGRRSLPALTKLIVALRILNPDVRILVCGQIANMSVSLVGLTGADAVAGDFDTAIARMENMLNLSK